VAEAGPTRREVVHGAARLAVVERGGAGDAVVFLHAGVADHRMWRGQLDTLSDRWRCVAYDRRGFGATHTRPEPYTRVGDLVAVLDALRIERAVLVGCSQGGRTAIDAALAHPDRVRALVLVASAVTGAPEVDGFAPEIAARLEALEAAEAREDLEAVNELEAQLWLDGPAQPAGRVGGAVRALFLAMNGDALRLAATAGEALAAPSAWPRLHEIAVPTLVVWGPLDFPHLVERMRQLVAAVPGARGHELGGTAHLPNLERPEAFDALLREFLALHAAGRAAPLSARAASTRS